MEPKRLPDKLAVFLPRGGLAALAEGIELMSLWRWARLSLLVGAVVGLAATGVFYALEWVEGYFVSRDASSLWWLLLILPPAGGLAAGLISWKFAPETAGSGTNAFIDAYHNNNGLIRARVPIVKLVVTLCTLGTGGSAGREGPMAHIGAGFGSYLGTALGLTARERRLLLLAGAASGISALFRTPLGASLWALEILYRDDFESDGMFPCLVSSVTAYSVSTQFHEHGSLFSAPSYDFHPYQLLFYAAMAVACAPLAVAWVKGGELGAAKLRQLAVPVWLKPAIGGLLLGALCIGVPYVFASGTVWLQDALRDPTDAARRLPIGYRGFWLMLGIACAKMVATTLTVGSGGSGGRFAPSLFIGGFIGGAFGLLFHELAPSIVTQPGAFVFVGMAAFYAGISHTPIATIILVSELFGSYDLLVPLMLTEMFAVLALRRIALHTKQVKTRRHSPVHVADFTVDVLEQLRVADHFTTGRAANTVPASMNLARFLEHVSQTADSLFVVRGRSDELVGIVSLSNVRSVVAEREFLAHMVVSDAMWPFRSLPPGADLRAALREFLSSGYDHLPVVDPADPQVVLGMLSQQQVFGAYNAEILRRRIGRTMTDDSWMGG